MPHAAYDLAPFIDVPGHACARGWDAVAHVLADAARAATGPVVVDAYPGLHDDEVLPALTAALGLRDDQVLRTERDLFLPPDAVDALVAPDLGDDDPIFGRLTRLALADFFDPDRLADARQRVAATTETLLVYGPGASLVAEGGLRVYADMPRWEGQLRQRRGEVRNLGADNRGEKGSLQYKRGFFVDWRVCDRHKRDTMARWDFYLDTVAPGDPRLISGDALRDGLREATRRPFRFVPFFDPGPWGGQWMRERFGLPDGPPNYAWGFDCVPEENSLVLGVGAERVEVPGMTLVLAEPEALLGEPVYGRMGAEFPIRTDFLDTMGGGNLSFQVHPTLDYAAEHFGLRYTQDESYYLLDAGPDAEVFLGVRDDIEPAAMLADLRAAQADPARPFPDERHVARFPARKHDHFLIPAGTVHCSGANSMVLEISHTPYIFTFKLWDWARLGLDGLPRPINVERGEAVIRWDRTASFAAEHLVNAVEPLGAGDGWREERTGLYRSQLLETRRHWFTGTVPHDTQGRSVHVINLVEGDEAVVESPTGAFAPFVVHYAETVVVPAAVGAFTIRPHGPSAGRECATLTVTCRT
jgi:hypothetical protein